jgi:large subunit ribosomal protein L10
LEIEMSVTRAQKEEEINELRKGFEENGMVIMAHYAGLTVKQLTDLRRALYKEGGSFKIAKNTLVKIAIKGTKFEGLADKFAGPTGIAFSKDEMAAARVTHKFAKDNEKLVVLGGANSNEVLSLDTIKFLATLPSLDALRGKIIGILQAPGAQLARLANAYATKS